MPPKKKPRNAFLIFTIEWKNKEEKRGNRLSLREATDRAGKIWAEMKPSERAPYTEAAKRERLQGQDPGEKYTSQGVPISHIENEKKERDTEERLMKKYIEDTIKRAVVQNNLPDQRFVFIMANYFAKTVEGNIFVPAEIALSSYSLKEGVNNTFHSCINPEVGIFGHAYEAMRHTESTHKLPLPPNAIGEKKLGKLYNEMLKFILPDGTKEYPPVFTHKESIPIIKSILDSMRFDGYGQDVELKVYPIQYLFYTLKKAAAQLGEVKMPESIFVTDVIFDRDTYEYHQGISCDYHEKIDNSKFCALSCVVRWGYMFSDYICLDLALPLIPGRHVPVDADLTIHAIDDSKLFNDSESLVSERTYASTFTDLTQPKCEQFEDAESHVSSYQLNKNDTNFPALGARPKVKSCAPSEAGTSAYGDDDEDSKPDNPWAVRSKVKARLPSDDSFSFGSVVSGRGRGLYIKSESPTPPPQRTGYGRGRYFDEN